MPTLMWRCDTCKEANDGEPWNCPGCDKEVCEHCFDSFAHCKRCCEGKTEEQLIAAANAVGWEFDQAESE